MFGTLRSAKATLGIMLPLISDSFGSRLWLKILMLPFHSISSYVKANMCLSSFHPSHFQDALVLPCFFADEGVQCPEQRSPNPCH